MSCLEGTNVTPKTNVQAKNLIGKKIEYILRSRIDTYRGWYSSCKGEVTDAKGKNLEINNSDWIYIPDVYEMVIIE